MNLVIHVLYHLLTTVDQIVRPSASILPLFVDPAVFSADRRYSWT